MKINRYWFNKSFCKIFRIKDKAYSYKIKRYKGLYYKETRYKQSGDFVGVTLLTDDITKESLRRWACEILGYRKDGDVVIECGKSPRFCWDYYFWVKFKNNKGTNVAVFLFFTDYELRENFNPEMLYERLRFVLIEGAIKGK